MRKLIYIICFLLNSIYFMPFSYGQDGPTTFDEIGHQLQEQACSAGENRFNKLAFGVTDESISMIKALIRKNGALETTGDSVHKGESAIYFTVFVCNGKMSYCSLDSSHNTQVIKRANKDYIENLPTDSYVKVKRIADDSLESSHDRYDIIKSCATSNVLAISPEVYEIITKITENMVTHTNKKYMKMWFSFFNDDSTNKDALNWHRDFDKYTAENAEFLAFAVLDITRPINTNATPPSQIKLGSIKKEYEALYHSRRYQMTKEPDYVPMQECISVGLCSYYVTESRNVDNCVQPLIELKNCTGTGYIIDQSMTREDGTKIVHSRDARPYNAVRVSMIIRCYCSDDANEMMKNSEYKKIKDIGDKNMYISAPSKGECKKRSVSNLEELTIPSSGPVAPKKYKRSSSIPITIEGAGI
ncbi:MAG: hypothetical protein QS748_02185 [Candidatus Endonucleobacter bathymodioli]|uniref:Uncharacterized protein n=1 Tax=Candidatus Endonucleibacter bathymodioli TaxID=539814 RepID=A0AA90NK51_9GAMM|nr:hypothetical protein [Candidatus Endonucleobacter bathymodioli]